MSNIFNVYVRILQTLAEVVARGFNTYKKWYYVPSKENKWGTYLVKILYNFWNPIKNKSLQTFDKLLNFLCVVFDVDVNAIYINQTKNITISFAWWKQMFGLLVRFKRTKGNEEREIDSVCLYFI